MTDFTALLTAATKTEDHTKIIEGGGASFPVLAAGPTPARLISYVELGQKKTTFQGDEKIADEVRLTFELFGKKHPPIIGKDGKEFPRTISLYINKGFSAKANFPKLLKKMDPEGKAKIFAQLVGSAFLVDIQHVQGKNGTVAVLKTSAGFHVGPPVVTTVNADGDAEVNVITVPAARTPLSMFLWNHPTVETFSLLGAKTQERIRSAINFPGSNVEAVLSGVIVASPAAAADTSEVPW